MWFFYRDKKKLADFIVTENIFNFNKLNIDVVGIESRSSPLGFPLQGEQCRSQPFKYFC
jgi:hypothetical protein